MTGTTGRYGDLISLAEGRRVAPGASNGQAPAPGAARILRDEGDILNAARFVEEHGQSVRYAAELGRWLVWAGTHWLEDRLEVVYDLGRQTVTALQPWVVEAAGSDDEWKRRFAHFRESSKAGRIDGMLKVARANRALAVAAADLDRHPHLLACANGTVDLRSGELAEPEPDDLITRGVHVDYDPHARSAEWEAFLATVFGGDGELVAYVQRLFGYAATGETSEHVLPILWGTGANGKSTFVTAVAGVLGEHYSSAPEGLLTEAKHEQHPERLAQLRGRRLVVSSELERRATLAEGLVKSLTGGDRISARHLYGQRFEFAPSHTMVLVTNEAPKVRGTDEAIWRRLRMVPFTVTIPPDERVRDYGRLLGERHAEAILAWLVAGAVAWYRDGLGESRQVTEATDGYRQREDVVGQFLDERTIGVAGRTPVKDLRAAWREWAQAQGVAVGRDQDFSHWLAAHGVELETVRGARYAIGVGILVESGDEQGRATPGDPSSGDHSRARTRGRFTEQGLRGVAGATEQQLAGEFEDDREGQPW